MTITPEEMARLREMTSRDCSHIPTRFLESISRLLDHTEAQGKSLAELEYLDTWAHHNGLNIKDAEQRAENIIQQAIGGLLWSKEAFEGNREFIKSYLVDQFKEQAFRIAELERELEPLRKGTHWPAPWKMTREMHDAYNAALKAGVSAGRGWSELRDVCLAEQDKEDGR